MVACVARTSAGACDEVDVGYPVDLGAVVVGADGVVAFLDDLGNEGGVDAFHGVAEGALASPGCVPCLFDGAGPRPGKLQ